MVVQAKTFPTLLVEDSERKIQPLVSTRQEEPKKKRAQNDEGSSCTWVPVDARRENRKCGLVCSDSFSDTLSSTYTVPKHVGIAPTSAMVRTRYLSRLGFSPKDCNCHSTKRIVPPLRRVSDEKSFKVLLKCEDDETSQISNKYFPTAPNRGNQTKPVKSVGFWPLVTVHPVPSHRAYSPRVRDTIWVNFDEMQKSVARNCVEFAAENWDWHDVCEEKDMFVRNGKLVHPVHMINFRY